MNFFVTQVVEDCFVVYLVTVVLDARRWSILAEIKTASTNEPLAMTWVCLVVQPIVLEANHAIEDPNFHVAVSRGAGATFQL